MTGSGPGVVGSLRNGIKSTSDDGATWKSIPTPLDQGALERGDDRSDYRIEKLALFGELLLAEQGGHVFVTPRKKIAWHELSPPVITFAIDPDAPSFVGVT